MTSNALYAIGTNKNWEANVSSWISKWPGDTKLPEERESHTAGACVVHHTDRAGWEERGVWVHTCGPIRAAFTVAGLWQGCVSVTDLTR